MLDSILQKSMISIQTGANYISEMYAGQYISEKYDILSICSPKGPLEPSKNDH